MIRLLPVLLLAACSGPIVVPINYEPLPVPPVMTKQLDHCWRTATDQVCWPVGSRPEPWQRDYLEQPGEQSLCKDGHCEIVELMGV